MRGLGHTQRLGDVVEGGRGEPALAEEIRRRAENLVAHRLLLAPAPGNVVDV